MASMVMDGIWAALMDGINEWNQWMALTDSINGWH
jgi:hypothetical protein